MASDAADRQPGRTDAGDDRTAPATPAPGTDGAADAASGEQPSAAAPAVPALDSRAAQGGSSGSAAPAGSAAAPAGSAPGPPAPRDGGEDRWMRVALPLVVLLLLFGGTLALWRVQASKDRRDADLEMARRAAVLATAAGRALEAQVGHLRPLATDLRGGRLQAPDEFIAAAQRVGEGSPAYRAIAWVNRVGTAQSVWSRQGDPDLRAGAKLKAQARWVLAIDRAERERVPRVVLTGVRDRGGEALFLLPVVSGEGPSAAYIGSLAARLDLDIALAGVLGSPTAAGFDLDLADGVVLFRHGAPIPADDARADVEPVVLLDRTLLLRARAGAGAGQASPSGWAPWVLWGGAAVSCGVSAAVWRGQERRARAARRARRQLRALEDVTRTAALLTGSPDAAERGRALDRLAAAARRAVGARIAVVTAIDEASGRAEVVAHDNVDVTHLRKVYRLEETRGALNSVRTGRMLVSEDIRSDPRVNAPAMEVFGVRAVMITPLIVGGRAIGALYLGHGTPRRFSDEERQLAELMGSQAAVILANYRLVREKEEALAMREKMAAQREALYQVASEIYRSEDLGESLQRVADMAPAIMGVDLCAINLRTGRGTEMQVAAVTRNFNRVGGETFDPTGTHGEQVWQTRQMCVVPDAEADPRIHPAFRHRLHIRAAIYLPLLGTGGTPIGLMVLIRHAPGAFTPEQLELAGALGARASTAIEKAQLYDATRKYAQTQAMLLRELNHRVKNNLASIVTLLTLNRPPLPPFVALWLDRATARVATMARTHELFVAGTESVRLADLVAKLLPALSVIKPAGVEVRTDLDGAEARFGTERAVNLAMVLNELCWNALEHGVGATGVLELRAGPTQGEPGWLRIEVEDRVPGVGDPDPGRGPELETVSPPGAGGHDPQAGPAPGLVTPRPEEADGGGRRGMGLRLVEGLVTRELGGRFSLYRTSRGGRLARLEIPAAEVESEPR